MQGRCGACKLLFASDTAFEAHRVVGKHHPGPRACLDPDAMRAKGMRETLAGWRTEGRREK